MDPRTRLHDLAAQVLEHRRRYYILDEPVLSDAEYDALEQELRALEAAHPDLADPNSPTQRVGATPLDRFQKTPHRVPMLSLDNAYSREELLEWEARLLKLLPTGAQPTYVAELKVDGLSLSLTYAGRTLIQALTRGDGTLGEDVTANARTISDIPLELPDDAPEDLEVRGEVFLSRRRWEQLNAARDARGEARFANPRNAASGTMKLLDSREVAHRRLQFLPWQWVDAPNHQAAMPQLTAWGFAPMPACATGSLDSVWAFIEAQSEARLALGFDTDGVVIKVSEIALQQILGTTDRVPRWAIAFKYPARQATSTLRAITWQVGRSGRLTPVAELDPVTVAGSTVRRATLHNVEELGRLGLRVGCKVFLEKGGDVIPKVVALVPGSLPEDAPLPDIPSQCPICTGPVGKEDETAVAIQCLNPECPAKLEARLLHLGSRAALDIEGLGEAVVVQLLNERTFQQPWDLFSLLADTRQSLSFLARLPRLGEKSAQNLLEALDGARTRPLARWIHGLGIPFVGSKTAENLAQAFPTLTQLWAASEEALQAVDEVGPKVSNAIGEFRALHPDLPSLLEAMGIAPEPPSQDANQQRPLEGQIAVVTGTLPTLSREAAESLLKRLGAKVTGSVSAKTTLLVAGEKAGSKLDKAQALGIPVHDEAWLLNQEQA